jgi:hypothetical protein
MKKLNQLISLAAIGTLGATLPALAADSTNTNWTGSATSTLYRPNEFSIDLFGTGSVGRQTINNISGNRISHDGRLGAGVGANYFFTRYFGIGGDAYTENTAGSFVDNTSGNLVARLPLGTSGLAPYIFGGGGYQFDQVQQGFGQGGAGLEYRFTEKWGVFVDARYVIADKTADYGVGRVGLRLSF